MKTRYYTSICSIASMAFLMACGGGSGDKEPATDEKQAPVIESMVADDPLENPLSVKGVGPITSVALDDEVDQELASRGEEVYKKVCTLCHRPDSVLLGPSPQGILERRSPEWVMNMILNPTEMLQKDPIAIKLLEEYNGVQMTDQNVSEEDARAILEYFRTLD